MFFAAPTQRIPKSIALFFVISLTACGGGGGGASALPSATSSTPTPFSIVSQNGNNIELTGTINALIAGGFSIQGGPSVGYLHIYTNSLTVITGPAPFVGESVDIVGTGSVSTSVTATSVKQLAVSTPFPSGTPGPASTPTPASVSSTPTPIGPSPTPIGATPTPVAATPTPLPVAAGAPITLPNSVLSHNGQIDFVSPTRVEIRASDCGYGHMYIYLNSATAYLSGSPQLNQYGSFTGTSSTRCGSLTATSVLLSSTPFASATISGTVASAVTYGFLLETNSGNIPVAMSSSTVVYGAALTVGSNVTVTGLGTASGGLAATQIAVAQPATPAPAGSPTPTPGPISMTHVQTFSFVYGYSGTPTSVPLTSMTPYLTWGMTDQAHAAALRAAGVKTQIYTNFWRNYNRDNPNEGYVDLEPGGVHASAEATDCSGTPVYDTNYGGGYEADARSSSALAHAQIVVNYMLSEYGPNYDAVFADDSGAVNGITLPCNYSQSTYDQAVNAVHAGLGVPIWINALGAFTNPASAIDLAQASNVLGAMCEECYSANPSGGDTTQGGTSWQNVENAEIGMIAQRKVFWAYPRASGSAAAETGLRTYVYASFLLSYDPAYTMINEALSTPSGFPVMPETLLVPMNPLTTAGNVSGYQAAGGAYMRQFGGCYYAGTFVGNCAVVVNSSGSNEPVPTTSYGHSMVLSGSGVLDGGSVSFNGGTVSQLAPKSAAILFP